MRDTPLSDGERARLPDDGRLGLAAAAALRAGTVWVGRPRPTFTEAARGCGADPWRWYVK